MIKGLHEDKKELFCNSAICNRMIDKFTQTQVIREKPDEYGEVYCLICGNWLCGEYDAFGEVGRFNHLNNNQGVILKLKDADKIIHDVKFALGNVIKVCRNLADLTRWGEDLLKRLSEIQDILNLTIEKFNNGT